jgi:diacylglycerol kinase (ATP)
MPPVVSISTLSNDKNAVRVPILLNPKAGPVDARPKAEQLAALLKERHLQAEIFTDLAQATTLANCWHADGTLRTLVGIGGDGTAAELANRTEPGVPLTLFPGGNSNLLARYFGLSKDPAAACRTILEGTAAKIDVGRANGRIFLLMAGIGFDAEVVARVHRNRTGHITLGNYVWPTLETAWRYRYPTLTADPVDADALNATVAAEAAERMASISARWLFAFNLPCYAGFPIAPHSDGSDGLLDLCGFRRNQFLGCFANVTLRRHRRSPDWFSHRVRHVRITADQEDVAYQLDGDPGGRLPLEIESLPARLTLVVPKESAVVKQSSII